MQTLPDTTRGFVWSATEFVIPAGKEDRLQICWTPNGVGKWRETIKVFDKNKYKTISEFIIISSANEAKKVILDIFLNIHYFTTVLNTTKQHKLTIIINVKTK